jgi:hypothetical protein
MRWITPAGVAGVERQKGAGDGVATAWAIAETVAAKRTTAKSIDLITNIRISNSETRIDLGPPHVN